jgi:signal transduction histidine kinase
VGGMVAHTGQPPGHQRDALQGPQLADKSVGRCALQQRLLDGGQLLVGQPGRGPLGPLLRSPSVPLALKRRCQTLTAWGERNRAGGRPRPGGRRRRPEPLPAGTEARIADFAELVATAIANTQARAELAASRARIVRSADQARRRIERDLHDGIQQRLVSLGLDLRATQAAVPAELPELGTQLARVADGLGEAVEELRELSRGIHPAILSEGGLAPALRALARRAAVPVELDVHVQERLPAPVEVAAYYVIAEALTNAAKHAHAALVQVDVRAADGRLHLSVGDDGVGGADPARGSGLVGLSDRVQALGGTITVHSPAGVGTRLLVDLPVEVDGD